jgi:hypothetical protein
VARVLVAREVSVPATTRTVHEYHVVCDGCSGPLFWEDSTGYQSPNVVELLLNVDECVSSRFRKDLCAVCLEPVWNALCAALGVDPEDISGSTYHEEEDDDSGDNGTDD